MKKNTDLIEKALKRFEAVTGMQVTLQKSPDASHDELLALKWDKSIAKYQIVSLNTLTPATYGQYKLQANKFKYPPIIITSYVSPGMADLLRKAPENYLDTAGNAFIQSPPLFILIKGNKPEEKPLKTTRMFQPSGLKIIFALLCNPGLEKKDYRTIATASGVALGSIAWVMRDLEQAGYIQSIGKKGRKLTGKDELLKNWVTNYHDQLRPRILLGRYSSVDENWWKKTSPAGAFLWGSEYAAKVITHYLKPEKYTLFVEEMDNNLLLSNKLHSTLKGNVDICKRFWNFEDSWIKKGIVPPLLVYADLISSQSDRNIETAKMIYENELKNLLK